MKLFLLAALCVLATADDKDCFKYDQTHGGHTVSLKETANKCREEFGMAQPEESKCVMQAYGAVAEDYALDCEKFKAFVDDYSNHKDRIDTMKTNAIKNCGCKGNIQDAKERTKVGEEFIKCWKNKLDETCKDDPKLAGGKINQGL